MLFLTEQEALQAVIMFLEHYCSETKSDNLKNILNQLKEAKKKNTLDTWSRALRASKGTNFTSTQPVILFTEKEAYDAMISILEREFAQSKAADIGGCLSDICYVDYGETADPASAYFWKKILHSLKNGTI